ncbi:MAG TPA: biopolymer transporter ExbD [Flavisolibacter sp.]|jgi:biopolymer transport protein ExbD|nr:biopolymer transporter ExbD [Flavisolibacter sp.]
MPSVKIPKKSTATDMTPFVDVAFLILSFFMLATKFKPPAPVTINTPHSVSADKLKEENAVLIEFDSVGRVYFTMNVKKSEDDGLKMDLIKQVNDNRKLGLTDAEMSNFVRYTTIGSPFAQVKTLLDLPKDERTKVKQTGIPVDSTNNELTTWIGAAKLAFQGQQVFYMIKGDNNATYPTFKGVIDALKANDELKYKLITDPKSAPPGTALYTKRLQSGTKGEE